MFHHEDLQDVLNILTVTIVRHKAEEDFFRNSAKSSHGMAAKVHFSEIAQELRDVRKSLEARKQKLAQELAHLKGAGQAAAN